MKLKLGVHAMVVGVATVVLGWFMSSRAAESGALAMIVLYRSVESFFPTMVEQKHSATELGSSGRMRKKVRLPQDTVSTASSVRTSLDPTQIHGLGLFHIVSVGGDLCAVWNDE